MNAETMNIFKKKWNNEEIESLRILSKKGYTYEELGNKFGVSANAIRKTIKRYKTPEVINLDYIKNWMIKRRLFRSTFSTTQLIIEFNKNRIKIGMPLYVIDD